MRTQPWWEERITSGLASYWLYQHLGNLSPDDLEDDPVWPKVRDAGDATRVLREFAHRADQEIEGTRWSYKRDFGKTRLVVIDSRCGRVLEGQRREMVDDDEFAWIEEQATGDFDHLLLATSLPFALAPAIHHLEEWNEAVAAGAWGRALAWAGEKIRQGIDLEHWAAFNDSFDRLAVLIEAVAAGHRGRPPRSVAVLSGDVHHTYLAELSFRGEHAGHGHSPAWQVVCSLRNPLPREQQAAHRRAFRRPAWAVTRWLARRAGVEPDEIGWRVVEGPRFENHLGQLGAERTAAGPCSGSSQPSPLTAATAPPPWSPCTSTGCRMAEGVLTSLARWPVECASGGRRWGRPGSDWRGVGGDRAYALLDARARVARAAGSPSARRRGCWPGRPPTRRRPTRPGWTPPTAPAQPPGPRRPEVGLGRGRPRPRPGPGGRPGRGRAAPPRPGRPAGPRTRRCCW